MRLMLVLVSCNAAVAAPSPAPPDLLRVTGASDGDCSGVYGRRGYYRSGQIDGHYQ